MTINEFIEAPNSIEFDYLHQKTMDLQLSRVQAEYRRYEIWKKNAEDDFKLIFRTSHFSKLLKRRQ